MACALFAAICGSASATVVAIGSIILPAMVHQGFPKRFGAGVIATSGALGILVPPSIILVLLRCDGRRRPILVDWHAVHGRHRSGRDSRIDAGDVTWFIALAEQLSAHAARDMARSACIAFRDGIWGLMLVVIVLGGIYSGDLYTDRGRGGDRGLRLRHYRLCLPRTEALATCRRCCLTRRT